VFLFQNPPSRGTGGDRVAEVGIIVKTAPQTPETPDLEGSESESAEEASSNVGQENAETILSELTPGKPEEVLPRLEPGLSAAATGAMTAFFPGQNPAGGAARREIGGKARVRLFGIVGEGRKFVYVFDRSDSMNWYNKRPLRAAKAELLASLESLEETHQFQIIFYNHEPLAFNPSGHANRLAFATEQNKRNAQSFVQSIVASGGTRHLEALLLAINFQPDVIFFLTDADDPQMDDGQLALVHRRGAGITIHAIEFGYGPQRKPNNFLVRLARQNGGQHTYVDISALPP